MLLCVAFPHSLAVTITVLRHALHLARRLANVWKTPSSPPPASGGAYLMYGQLTSLELQDVAPGSLARHRGRHSRKPSLQVRGRG